MLHSQQNVCRFADLIGIQLFTCKDRIADIIVRMRTDEKFKSAVVSIYKLDASKLQGVGEMLIPPSQNEQEIAEKFLMHKISQLPEDCKKELLGFCARLLKAESKKI